MAIKFNFKMQSQNFTAEEFEEFQAYLAFRKLKNMGAGKTDKENLAPVDENRGRKVIGNDKSGVTHGSKKSESEDHGVHARRDQKK